MFIIDSQLHLWGPNTFERPWLPGRPGWAHGPHLLADDIVPVMDANGVARTVIVPPRWDGDQNDLAIEAVEQYPGRFGIMGRIQLHLPESRGMIRGWRRQPGMLGLRLLFNDAPSRKWLTDGTADWIWPACEREGVPIMLVAPEQLPLIGEIAERHPGLKLLIDHMGLTARMENDRGEEIPARDADALRHFPDLLPLSKYPNVGVKVSSLPFYTREAYPFPTMQAAVRTVYDTFGPQRMFWGTDFSRQKVPYRQIITMFTEEMTWLPQDDLALIMGRSLAEWLDWPIVP